MAYPAPFHRIVLIGGLYDDIWNTSLSMIPTGGSTLPEPDDDLVQDVATQCALWFQTVSTGSPPTGIGITSSANLSNVKVNRIGTDGLYMDADTHEFPLSPVTPGANAFNPAPQLTIALTLRGTNERARAGRGRMYMPPSVGIQSIGSDGRMTAAAALIQAKGGLNLLSRINDVYLTAGVPAVAGIASKAGLGAFQGVAQVSVGRVVDTMRSRRNKLSEDPEYWGAP